MLGMPSSAIEVSVVSNQGFWLLLDDEASSLDKLASSRESVSNTIEFASYRVRFYGTMRKIKPA